MERFLIRIIHTHLYIYIVLVNRTAASSSLGDKLRGQCKMNNGIDVDVDVGLQLLGRAVGCGYSSKLHMTHMNNRFRFAIAIGHIGVFPAHKCGSYSLLTLNVKWFGYELLRKPLIGFERCWDKSASMAFSLFNILHCLSPTYEGMEGLNKYLAKFNNIFFLFTDLVRICACVCVRVYMCLFIFRESYFSRNSLQETKNIGKG